MSSDYSRVVEARRMLFSATSVCAGYRRGADVLHEVSLDVNYGELVALVGRNGAGKTSMLRVIAGALRARSGCMNIAGKPHPGSALKAARAGIVYVPEGRGIFKDLTVIENLRLGGIRQEHPAMDEVHELFPALGELGNRKAGMLSGGEQQMLALARGFIAEPTLLLIDEATLGLSAGLAESIIEEIGRQAAARSIGILIVDQDIELVGRNADRIYVLEDGKIRRVGDSQCLDEVIEMVTGWRM